MAYQWKAIARTHSVLSPFDSRSLSLPRLSFIGGAHERFPPLMKSSYKQSKGSLDFRFFSSSHYLRSGDCVVGPSVPCFVTLWGSIPPCKMSMRDCGSVGGERPVKMKRRQCRQCAGPQDPDTFRSFTEFPWASLTVRD